MGAELVALVRERYANDLPIAVLEDFVIAESMTLGAGELETSSLNSLLEDAGWPVDRVEYEISAVGLQPEHAEIMGSPAGTPILRELRSDYRGETLIHFSSNYYHPVNYRLRGVVDR
uniref:Putative transcription regulator n=1 Tax=Microbacterium sp. MA1 TaxID=614068 RepID=C3UN05_9MICO|nr:putative transcription regulator [Microbacterium sp. MA1]